MAQSAISADAHPAPARILIVEDEPLIRFSMAEALREHRVCVVEAANADEAWTFMLTGGAVDVVFTDHRMPGSMLGDEFAARVGRDFPKVRVVLTSANLGKVSWSGSFLPKPYDLFNTAAYLVEQALVKRQLESDL